MKSLRDALAEYLALRRALGTQLREPGTTLDQFLDFLEREGSEVITIQLALRWATLPVGVQRATWARRLSMVRQFAAWRSAFDPRTEVPPMGILGGHRQRTPPHIYSDYEVGRLMAEAAKLHSASGVRPWTYMTLLGLLASTGLRPGEALALNVADVDLLGGILTVRDTKFGKTRFVPVAESTRVALLCYARRRDRLCKHIQTNAFLVSERGTRIQPCAARRTLWILCQAIGLRPKTKGGPRRRGPRLQDFRHTLATMKLIEWHRAGLDVSRELPKLSTYLGHSEICHTYWYLQAIPELLQLAAQRLETVGKEASR
jgi:integrase